MEFLIKTLIPFKKSRCIFYILQVKAVKKKKNVFLITGGLDNVN